MTKSPSLIQPLLPSIASHIAHSESLTDATSSRLQFPELLNFDTANLWNFIGDARASDATSAEVTRALAASAGAIWLKRQVYALDWNVSVQYRYSAASSPPGDGLCIVLHRDTTIGTSNPGWGGAYMGYGGIRNSTALSVDLYTDASKSFTDNFCCRYGKPAPLLMQTFSIIRMDLGSTQVVMSSRSLHSCLHRTWS